MHWNLIGKLAKSMCNQPCHTFVTHVTHVTNRVTHVTSRVIHVTKHVTHVTRRVTHCHMSSKNTKNIQGFKSTGKLA